MNSKSYCYYGAFGRYSFWCQVFQVVLEGWRMPAKIHPRNVLEIPAQIPTYPHTGVLFRLVSAESFRRVVKQGHWQNRYCTWGVQLTWFFAGEEVDQSFFQVLPAYSWKNTFSMKNTIDFHWMSLNVPTEISPLLLSFPHHFPQIITSQAWILSRHKIM